MNTLNQWEAEAKAYLKAYEGMSNYLPEERILALIELVRKKDEALKIADKNFISFRSGWCDVDKFRFDHVVILNALALTEELK